MDYKSLKPNQISLALEMAKLGAISAWASKDDIEYSRHAAVFLCNYFFLDPRDFMTWIVNNQTRFPNDNKQDIPGEDSVLLLGSGREDAEDEGGAD